MGIGNRSVVANGYMLTRELTTKGHEVTLGDDGSILHLDVVVVVT